MKKEGQGRVDDSDEVVFGVQNFQNNLLPSLLSPDTARSVVGEVGNPSTKVFEKFHEFL